MKWRNDEKILCKISVRFGYTENCKWIHYNNPISSAQIVITGWYILSSSKYIQIQIFYRQFILLLSFHKKLISQPHIILDKMHIFHDLWMLYCIAHTKTRDSKKKPG